MNYKKQTSISSFFSETAEVPEKKKKTESQDQKKKYEDKRVRGWVSTWPMKFPGLVNTDRGMVCTFCRQFPALAGDTVMVTGCKSYRVESLCGHFSSQTHMRCVKAAAVQKRIEAGRCAGPLDQIVNKLGEHHYSLVKKLFNTAYCVVVNEMPFTTFPNLLKLQIKNGSDLDQLISYQSDKACARFTSFIAAAVNEPIQKALSEAKALSIIFDGATDTSVAEVEIVYCRIVVDGRPKEYFVGLQDLQHAHSEGVVQALDRAMRQFGCDDWLQKLVGTGSDGASVNVGANNSVRTRLQNGRPYVVNTHCVAHRLELGALQAIKNNPMLQTLEEMFKLLHKHYHYSPKALRELGQIAEMMEERIIKPTRLQGTRWLPHIMQASKALMNGYGPILAHFEHVSQAAPGQTTAEVKGRATYLAKKLKDWRVIRFMAFFQDLLEIVSGLSLKFQQSSMTCLDFLDALEAANLQLVELGQGPGQHFSAFQNAVVANDEGDHFYRGAKLTHVDVQQLYNFGDVIDSVQERINGRLDNKDNILCLARVFDTRDWPNTRVDLATYGNNNIESLSVHFAQVLDRLHCNRDQLRPQWLEAKAHLGHRLIANRIQRPTIQDLFQDRDRFSHLLILVDICLTLPVSSAICERGFSAVKRIKSDWRSSLSTQMLNHLLAISIEGPSLEDYDAERAVHLWWTRGQRTRRPQFEAAADHVAPGDQDGEDQLLNFFLQHNHLQLAGQ